MGWEDFNHAGWAGEVGAVRGLMINVERRADQGSRKADCEIRG